MPQLPSPLRAKRAGNGPSFPCEGAPGRGVALGGCSWQSPSVHKSIDQTSPQARTRASSVRISSRSRLSLMTPPNHSRLLTSSAPASKIPPTALTRNLSACTREKALPARLRRGAHAPFCIVPQLPYTSRSRCARRGRSDHDRLNRPAVGQQSEHREDQLLRFVHPVESGALGLAERPCAFFAPVAALFSAVNHGVPLARSAVCSATPVVAESFSQVHAPPPAGLGYQQGCRRTRLSCNFPSSTVARGATQQP
jgi:hypothetical protein